MAKKKWLLINTLKRNRWQMIGHSLRHGDKLHSLIIEVIIEGRLRGRPWIKYISQIIKDVGVTSHKKLNEMVNDREKFKKPLL